MNSSSKWIQLWGESDELIYKRIRWIHLVDEFIKVYPAKTRSKLANGGKKIEAENNGCHGLNHNINSSKN